MISMTNLYLVPDAHVTCINTDLIWFRVGSKELWICVDVEPVQMKAETLEKGNGRHIRSIRSEL